MNIPDDLRKNLDSIRETLDRIYELNKRTDVPSGPQGRLLHAIRKEKNLTNEEFASSLNIDLDQLEQLMYGNQKITVELAQKLTAIYGVPEEHIVKLSFFIESAVDELLNSPGFSNSNNSE